MFFSKKITAFVALCSTSTSIWSVHIETLFAPDDRPTTRLIKEINETRNRILAAIYYISDPKIIDALIQAHQRNVEVRIISDEQTSNTCYSKVKYLQAAGIPVFVPKQFSSTPTRGGFVRHRLMHDKFAILDHKIWTGSFNWTVGANVFNYENVVIIHEDPNTHLKFYNRYYAIEKMCEPYNPFRKSIVPWADTCAILAEPQHSALLPVV